MTLTMNQIRMNRFFATEMVNGFGFDRRSGK
jgi:hypothetical protein